MMDRSTVFYFLDWKTRDAPRRSEQNYAKGQGVNSSLRKKLLKNHNINTEAKITLRKA